MRTIFVFFYLFKVFLFIASFNINIKIKYHFVYLFKKINKKQLYQKQRSFIEIKVVSLIR